jgi:hypothetical protein
MGMLLASAGGKVYEVLDNGTSKELFQPFAKPNPNDPDPFIELSYDTDTETLFCAAGVGGGPIVQRRKRVRGVWVDQGSFFVGPASSRTGVALQGVPYPPLPPRLERHAKARPDESEFQRIADAVRMIPARFLQRYPTKIVVYKGASLVAVFPELRGQQTSTPGDGSRTWDTVPAAYGFGDLAVVNEDATDVVVVHEYAHGVWVHNQQIWPSFTQLHGQVPWPNQYERLNVSEAFAQTFMRWALRFRQPDSRLNSYMERTFPA